MVRKASTDSRVSARFRKMQPVLGYAAAHLDEDVSLAALARQAKLSAFHLQRIFSATVGETPKQLTLRLRLGRAAVMLLASSDSILDVALSCGFQSHEVFIRGFGGVSGSRRALIASADSSAAPMRHKPGTTPRSSSRSTPALGCFTSANRKNLGGTK